MSFFKKKKVESVQVFLGVRGTARVELDDRWWRGSVTYKPVIRFEGDPRWHPVDDSKLYQGCVPRSWHKGGSVQVVGERPCQVYGIDGDVKFIWNDLTSENSLVMEIPVHRHPDAGAATETLRVAAQEHMTRRLAFWRNINEIVRQETGSLYMVDLHQQQATVKEA